ncbi:hypothetical protein N5D66_30680 [Delftia tsuruhatensis]|uniref:hypothetical protein n=1 Tax=Delftia tsuruhatensis TaxID=180282 RepID=UPI00244CE4F1|nr:hypothetical protein [Delftia tsuruhatensis]MDH0852319.1 hypothetical protein [Delftia tsuruhatensis]
MRDLKHRAAFEQQGETYVRMLAEQTDYVGKEARAWLGEQQVKREEEAAKLRDAREEETLRLARAANEIAARSVKIAWIGAGIAALAVIVTALVAILS